jgi:hypothetical protein
LVEVSQVTPEAVYGQSGDLPALVYVGVEDGALVAAGGLAWHHGRCWLWVDRVDAGLTNPFALVRWGRRMLKVAQRYGDNVVSAVRDPSQVNSAKLLKLMGFVLVDPEGVSMVDGTKAELWECRHSP